VGKVLIDKELGPDLGLLVRTTNTEIVASGQNDGAPRKLNLRNNGKGFVSRAISCQLLSSKLETPSP